VSLTATLVVGVSLGLLVEREHPEMLRGNLAGPASTRPESAPAPAEKSEAGATNDTTKSMAPAAALPTQEAAPARRAAPRMADTFEAEARPATPLPQAETRQAGPPAVAGGVSAPTKAARESSLAADAATGPDSATAPVAGMAPPASPESWLDAIRRLQRAGRDREAAAQLLAFRKAYPDYHLPEDLAGRPSPASRDD
ncbi:MAG: hypothetical protein HGA75_17610, partial [Thiobacillus sp.]|nr:hypothetical protein [Thiobacillus sp.]